MTCASYSQIGSLGSIERSGVALFRFYPRGEEVLIIAKASLDNKSMKVLGIYNTQTSQCEFDPIISDEFACHVLRFLPENLKFYTKTPPIDLLQKLTLGQEFIVKVSNNGQMEYLPKPDTVFLSGDNLENGGE